MGVGTLRRHRDYSSYPQPVLQEEKPSVGGSSVVSDVVVKPVVTDAVVVETKPDVVVVTKPAAAVKPKHKFVEKLEEVAVQVAEVAFEAAKQD